jgi:hypothetical protein
MTALSPKSLFPIGVLLAVGAVLASCVVVEDRPPPRPGGQYACPMIYAPVCARRDGRLRTFDNACTARARGWRTIADGPCRDDGFISPRPPVSPRPPIGEPRPEPLPEPLPEPFGRACTREYTPVCGITDAGLKTYPNRCSAQAAGVRDMKEGEC